jgi:hypothetical protein
MPYPSSPLSYGDVKELLDKALDAERGIKLIFDKHGYAINMRQRASRFRAMDRESNKKVYPEGHPMHGRSAYDTLAFRIVTGPRVTPPPTLAEKESGKPSFHPPYEIHFEKIDMRVHNVEEL